MAWNFITSRDKFENCVAQEVIIGYSPKNVPQLHKKLPHPREPLKVEIRERAWEIFCTHPFYRSKPLFLPLPTEYAKHCPLYISTFSNLHLSISYLPLMKSC
jgi:hypothetical protein